MTGLKLGTLTTDVKCWQGIRNTGLLCKGWIVLFRGYAPITGHHFVICQCDAQGQYAYFCHESDVTAALYSPVDAVIDLMLQSGVTLADIRKHSKADQL